MNLHLNKKVSLYSGRINGLTAAEEMLVILKLKLKMLMSFIYLVNKLLLLILYRKLRSLFLLPGEFARA